MHKRKKSRIWTYILVLLFVYSSYTMYNLYKDLNIKKLQCSVVQTKIDEQKKQKEELKKQKETINSDKYMEKVAREKLGLVKKGEQIFIDTNK